jgi:anti-anti-sigma factor
VPQALLAPDPLEVIARRLPLEFRCEWKAGPVLAWVHVEGQLVFSNATRLERALREAQTDTRLVVVDLRGLTRIDRCGLSVILDGAAEAEWRGGRLLVVRGRARVDRMFTISGACNRLPLFDLEHSGAEAVPSEAEIERCEREADGNPNLDGESPTAVPERAKADVSASSARK